MHPPLKIDSNLVFQIFGDDAFYVANPCFLAMEENGKLAYEQYLGLAQKKKQSCSSCGKNLIQTTLGSFAKLLKRLAEVAPDEVEKLVQYLSRRMGYRPPYLILYYKDRQGELQELRCGHSEQGGSHVGSVYSLGTVGAGAGDGAQ